MSVFRMVLAEIGGRPINFGLSVLAITTAVSMFVVGQTLIAGYSADTNHRLAEMDNATRLYMRDLGVNLRIVHRDTDMNNFYTKFEVNDFPEHYVQTLATAPQIQTIVHLNAILQQPIGWNEQSAILTGILPVLTASQKNAEKPHMYKPIKSGTVAVGHLLAQKANLKAGDEVEILGKKFKITSIRPEAGNRADVQLVVHLHDAQELLGKNGRINQIMALGCKCKGDRISVIREELEGVLPDTKITEHETLATAREKQRDLVAKERKKQASVLSSMTTYLIPFVVLVAALFVGVQTWLNVRERRDEIGLLRALGKPTGNVVALFMLKALILGSVGGAAGCLVGVVLSVVIGRTTLQIPGEFSAISLLLVLGSMLGAILVTAMSSYLPMLSAVRQDPSIVLNDRG